MGGWFPCLKENLKWMTTVMSFISLSMSIINPFCRWVVMGVMVFGSMVFIL